MKFDKRLRFLMLLFGPALMALAVRVIYEPTGMVTGGISGFAIIIKQLTMPYVDGGVSVGLINVIVDIVLFGVAFASIKRKRIYKMIFGTFVFSVALFVIPVPVIEYNDFFLAAVFGGALTGLGLGMVAIADGSTGGTDLAGTLIHEKIRRIERTKILAILDGMIVIAGFFVFGITSTFYSIVAIYITMKIMDGVLAGFGYARMVYVISDKSEIIAQDVINSLNRGVTSINSKGMYSNKNKKMLICVTSVSELVPLTKIITKNDPQAFIIVSDVREVFGEGFMETLQ